MPTLAERSFSVYMLGLFHKEKNLEVKQLFERIYIDFFIKNQGMEKRISEQLKSGNIKCTTGGKCEITPRGEFIYQLNHLIATIFNLDKRCIDP